MHDPSTTRAKLRSRRRGAVMVEYAFLLVAISTPTALALIAGGKVMYDQYKQSRTSILAATP